MRVVAGTTVPLHLQLDVTTRRPVLFVPGFPGSSVRGHILYPTFENEEPADAGDLEIMNPFGTVWSRLERHLSPNFRVIPVPWDWRDISEERVKKYLVPAINAAKDQCDPPCDKVHIVAHSAGGILVRSYIQSDLYTERNDIDRFAMCGTPNRGAPILYYLWEGGDPLKADNIQDGWFDFLVNFYWNTYEELYCALNNDCSIASDTANSTSAARLSAPDDPVTVQDFIHEHLPIAGKLLPAYPFLERIGSTHLHGISEFGTTHEFRDSFLWKLNEENESKRRFGGEDNTDPNRVATKVFVGNREETVFEISVGSPGTHGLYWDGEPFGDPTIMAIGDGTVPWSSAVVPVLGYASIDDSKKAKHVDLMKEYATKICTFLNRGEPCIAVATAGEGVGDPDSFLIAQIRGRIESILIDPTGKRIGVDAKTGELVRELEESDVEGLASRTGFSIARPIGGDYELQLTAAAGEVFAIEVFYANTQTVVEARARGIFHEGVTSATIELNPESLGGFDFRHSALNPANTETRAKRGTKSPAIDSPATTVGDNAVHDFQSTVLRMYGQVEPAVNVRSKNNNGLTRIVWDHPDDSTVTGYNVYTRPDDMPKYTLLGTTAETFFDTPHPWNVAGSAPTWHYFVTAVNAEGVESFFTHTVENRHRLVARVSSDVTTGVEPLTVAFADASLGEVAAWSWDFNSDGVIDSTEQNPEYTFESPGSYTVTLTVGGPEGTDTTIRPGYITVEPTDPPPPPVSGDFDGDQDVDLADHAALVERMTGPFTDPTLAGWHLLDLDFDYDVDFRDFAAWQRLVTGCAVGCN